MSILLFIVILFFLVLIHELGHFVVAKWFGVKVEEFGFGYPPRAAKLFTWKGTLFTLNWLPFGGFVKIFGEDPTEEVIETDKKHNFIHAPKYAQALILIAGVFMNALFAWIVFVCVLTGGMFMSQSTAPEGVTFTDPVLTVLSVEKNSPAEKSGIKTGDLIRSVTDCQSNLYTDNLSIETFRAAVATCATPEIIKSRTKIKDDMLGEVLVLHVSSKKDPEIRTLYAFPNSTLANGKPGIGVGLDVIGTAHLSFGHAVVEGFKMTTSTTKAIFHGFADLFSGIASGNKGVLSNVTGPIGIVGAVGEAYTFGWAYVLLFAAMISLNLAIINILPFPALDGGRLLFVIIEAIIRRPIPAKVANIVNMVGFGLLLLLMVIVSFHDIWKLF